MTWNEAAFAGVRTVPLRRVACAQLRRSFFY